MSKIKNEFSVPNFGGVSGSNVGKVAGNITASGIAANYVKHKLSQYADPKLNISAFKNVQSAMNEILRNRIVNNLLGTGEVRRQRIEKLRSFVERKLKENPNFNADSFIKAVITRLVKKEIDLNAMDVPYSGTEDRKGYKTNMDLGYEGTEVIPPSDKQLDTKKKVILSEPPVDSEPDNVDESDEDKDQDNIEEDGGYSAADTNITSTDVPYGPYRNVGRDYNTTYLKLSDSKKIRSTTEMLQILFEKEKEDDDKKDKDITPEDIEGTPKKEKKVDPNASDPDAEMVGQAQGTTDPNATQNPNDAQTDPSMVGGQGDPNMQDPSMAGVTDPNMQGMSGMGGMNDPSMGMGGMGMQGQGMPGEMTADELGRIFELKKIYKRLLSIESYLSFSSDPELMEISNYVSKAIEFFELLASNIQAFKGKIDSIIIVFYEFLRTIYESLKDYYEKKEQKEKGKGDLSNEKNV